MKRYWGAALLFVALVAAGGGAHSLWGERPRLDAKSDVADERWGALPRFALALDAAEKVWVQRGPWGLPPKPEPVPPPPPPPPPVPVGIVGSRAGLEAVFIVPGSATEIRLKVGGRLPGGGRVTAINEFHIRWTDGKGDKHEHQLFGSPLPPLAPGA